MGKRFGFARLENVQDPRVFAVKLDNIIFGANKIHVNLPRFEREKHDERTKKDDERVKPVEKTKGRVDGIKIQQKNHMVWRKASDGGNIADPNRTKHSFVKDDRHVKGVKGGQIAGE